MKPKGIVEETYSVTRLFAHLPHQVINLCQITDTDSQVSVPHSAVDGSRLHLDYADNQSN